MLQQSPWNSNTDRRERWSEGEGGSSELGECGLNGDAVGGWECVGVGGGGGEGGSGFREGSQSNYRQRCRPGFFGCTKFTFQQSLPPSAFSIFCVPFSLSPSFYVSLSFLVSFPLCPSPSLWVGEV